MGRATMLDLRRLSPSRFGHVSKSQRRRVPAGRGGKTSLVPFVEQEKALRGWVYTAGRSR